MVADVEFAVPGPPIPNQQSTPQGNSIALVSKILVCALQVDQQSVYVHLKDAVDPFPLPK